MRGRSAANAGGEADLWQTLRLFLMAEVAVLETWVAIFRTCCTTLFDYNRNSAVPWLLLSYRQQQKLPGAGCSLKLWMRQWLWVKRQLQIQFWLPVSACPQRSWPLGCSYFDFQWFISATNKWTSGSLFWFFLYFFLHLLDGCCQIGISVYFLATEASF